MDEKIKELETKISDLRTQDTPAEEKKTAQKKPCKPETQFEVIGSFAGVNTPAFDEKTSGTNYVKQFEAAARVKIDPIGRRQ